MRVVFDTNVWVSALRGPGATPAQLIEALHRGELRVSVSERTWAELLRVLRYPKVLRQLGDRAAALPVVLSAIWPLLEMVPNVDPDANWIPDDPSDNWIIQCAITARADLVVSGDRHLRRLRAVGGIQIVTPAEALALLRTSRPFRASEPRRSRYRRASAA